MDLNELRVCTVSPAHISGDVFCLRRLPINYLVVVIVVSISFASRKCDFGFQIWSCL
jgi:hypothetical protein